MRLALASAAVLWFVALLAAPYAIGSARPVTRVGAACVYVTGGFVCHQRPERSFDLAGRQMPVCARCAGLYAAAALGASVLAVSAFAFGVGATWSGSAVRLVALAAALPTIVTWLVEHLGFVHLSNTTRFVAALPLGFTAAWLVLGLFPPGSRAGTRRRVPPR